MDAGGFIDERSSLRTAKPWGPGTPTLVSSLRNEISASDGGLQARHTGATTEELLKPLRGECGCDSGEPVVTTLACLLYYLHARLRVHRASGIPCALFYRRC